MSTTQFTDTPAESEQPAESERPAEWTQPDPASDPYAHDANTIETPYLGAQAPGMADLEAGDNWTTGSPGAPPILPPTFADGTGNGRPGRRRRGWKYGLAVLVLLLVLAGGFGLGRIALGAGTSGTPIGAQSGPAVTVSSNVSSLQQTVESVANAVAPSVVEITSVGNGQEAIGSGDILTANGYIVTNDHVVDGFSSYTVTLSNGTKLQAQLVGTDPQDDLAVIKVNATNLHPIAFANSSSVTVGEFAVAVGNPYGLRESATFGTVSATNRAESESPSGPASLLTGLIQTSAPIAPGNSGGALVNLQGQLIGIPTLAVSSQQGGTNSGSTVGFAIPSNQVKTVAQALIQSGHVTSSGQGFMGIQGEDVTPTLASADGLSVQSGVLVNGFANDTAGQSPARQGGLQSGDVIVAVNGQTIGDSNDLASAIAGQKPGTRVSVTVERGSSQITLNVTLGQRPAN